MKTDSNIYQTGGFQVGHRNGKRLTRTQALVAKLTMYGVIYVGGIALTAYGIALGGR
jgi:hypothetical protein